MSRRALAVLAILVGVGVAGSGSGLAAVTATPTVSIAAPADGRIAVAHLILNAIPKKPAKKKPGAKKVKPKPPAPPRIKAVAPVEGLIAAVSVKRDLKVKTRFDATVVVVNPSGGPVSLQAAGQSSAAPSTEAGMDMVMLTARGFHFDRVDETPDVVRMNDPVSWAGMCHPPSSIDAILFGGGSVGAIGILNGACLLLVDEAVPLDQMTALGIPYIYLELVEFPGPNEEYVLKISTNIPNINAVSVVFPSGAQITAHLPFPGTGCGIGPPNQINCGNPTPWLPVSETRQANMRFAAELGDGAEVTVFYSTDYGMHYDPGGFVRVYSG